MEEQIIKNKKRSNIWIVTTIFLGIVIGLLFLTNLYPTSVGRSSENGTWKDRVCSDLPRYQLGTPSWFDNDGNLIYKGYIDLSNITVTEFETQFINNKVYMVHRNGCSWCEKQIEDLERIEMWKTYQDTGLTIHCS
ncbi:MAG: hypothetical protein ABIH25_01010 [Candidatus Woesearchaeota archaeon]